MHALKKREQNLFGHSLVTSPLRGGWRDFSRAGGGALIDACIPPLEVSNDLAG